MSRLAREYPDQPEMWAAPPRFVVPRCWCGRRAGIPSAACVCCCLEHDGPHAVRMTAPVRDPNARPEDSDGEGAA
jgi:hypothetical protein